MTLRRYQEKRSFPRSPEPRGKIKKAPKHRGAPQFVIQKHAARQLHYDFRLEMDGVLKSWAVPKGLPTKHGERRLAIQVEDHPIEYATFEGIIPEGNYGAGTVMVWDTGAYTVAGGDPKAMLAKGKLHFTLAGKKLRGEWTLVRMKQNNEKQQPWLLFKSGTDLPSLSRRQDDQSATSGRSMKEIASDRDAAWESKRPKKRTGIAKKVITLPRAEPAFVEPMKARLTEDLPHSGQWLYEIKFDGVRAVTIKDKHGCRILSRNRIKLAGDPKIMAALKTFPCQQAVIDGELVALDEQGRSSFQLLQPYFHNQRADESGPPIVYYAFDLLNLEGHDLKSLPLWQRKELLQKLVAGQSDQIRFSASFTEHPERLIQEVKKRGLEGLVGKQRDSVYEPGRRSGTWIKIKCLNEQEFVIGGFTRPRNSRQYFGSLVIGFYQRGKLWYASKVGTGFSTETLRNLYHRMQKISIDDCPFVNLPSPRGDIHGIGPSEMKLCTWVKPRLVCQAKFGEWTRDGHLRQPVFLGLRQDKPAGKVVRESIS